MLPPALPGGGVAPGGYVFLDGTSVEFRETGEDLDEHGQHRLLGARHLTLEKGPLHPAPETAAPARQPRLGAGLFPGAPRFGMGIAQSGGGIRHEAGGQESRYLYHVPIA